jgi:hypothetical protein
MIVYRNLIWASLFLLISVSPPSSPCATWRVGPSRTYTAPSAVATRVADGDTVEIDAATYTDCATWSNNDLLIRGVGGMAHMKDAVCGQKGVMVLYGARITLENLELSDAAIESSLGSNGAGVRGQGGSFTIRNCFIHHNQMGVLCSMTWSDNVVIENSVISDNVSADESLFAHNIYVNTCDTFILRSSYIHGAMVGHNVKSRARVNYILYNRITDEQDSASRLIDLPNGGQAVVMGNMVEKGPLAQNTNSVGFGLEGMSNPGPQRLCVVNNTFINDLPARGISFIVPGSGMDTLRIQNNIFAGTGVLLNGAPHVLDTVSNLFTSSIPSLRLVNPALFDYRLTSSSPAIGIGSDAGSVDGFSLTPALEYHDTATSLPRTHVAGRGIDAGAYAYGGSSGVAASTGMVQVHCLTITIDPSNQLAMIQGGHTGIVDVIDVMGRRRMEKRVVGNNCVISIAALRSGVYWVEVHSEQGTQTGTFAVIR